MIKEMIVGALVSIHALAPAFPLPIPQEEPSSRDPFKNWLPRSRREAEPEIPVIKSIGSTKICTGQVAILTASPIADRYVWLKDGHPLSQQEARLVVAEAGNYTVHTIDEKGNKSAASKPVMITTLPKPHKPAISGPRSGCEGEIITLRAEDQLDGSVEFEWHRQMESTPFARGSIVQFTIHGDAVLYVTARSAAGCISDQIETIEIKSSTPQGSFNVSHNEIGKGGLVSFTSQIRNGASYRWNFGDGEFSHEKDPKHYFHQTGSYPISVSVRSADSCERVFSSTGQLRVYDTGQLPPEPALPAPGNAYDPSGQEWRLGPNPFHNQLNIFFDSVRTEDATLKIFNLYGSIVHSEVVPIVSGRNVISVKNLDRLAKGSYLIKVKTSSFLRTERLIKL